jgi:hypothetical protein
MKTVLAKDTMMGMIENQFFKTLQILWNAAKEKFGNC